jgi:hypothetical protein
MPHKCWRRRCRIGGKVGDQPRAIERHCVWIGKLFGCNTQGGGNGTCWLERSRRS